MLPIFRPPTNSAYPRLHDVGRVDDRLRVRRRRVHRDGGVDRVRRQLAQRVDIRRLLRASRAGDTGVAVTGGAMLLEASNRARGRLRARRGGADEQRGENIGEQTAVASSWTSPFARNPACLAEAALALRRRRVDILRRLLAITQITVMVTPIAVVRDGW